MSTNMLPSQTAKPVFTAGSTLSEFESSAPAQQPNLYERGEAYQISIDAPFTPTNHQPTDSAELAGERALITDHTASLHLKKEDGNKGVTGDIIQQLAAVNISREEYTPLPKTDGIEWAGPCRNGEAPCFWTRYSRPTAATETEVSDGRSPAPAKTSNTKQAPPKERERDPDDDGRAETTELAALLQPIIVNNPAPSGGEGLEEPVGVPHDDDNHPIAPPPSPASNARARAGAAGLEAFFKIWPSKLGGLGAFAVRELRRGQTILVERPLLRTTHFRLLPDFHKLSEGAKTAFLGLHGGEGGDPFGRVERIQRLNSFLVPGGIGIFEIASRFNHACLSVRNVQYVFDNEREVLSLTICQDIVPAGTELRLSYGGSPVELYANFGFRCYCGGCTPLTDEEVNLLDGKGHDVVGDW